MIRDFCPERSGLRHNSWNSRITDIRYVKGFRVVKVQIPPITVPHLDLWWAEHSRPLLAGKVLGGTILEEGRLQVGRDQCIGRIHRRRFTCLNAGRRDPVAGLQHFAQINAVKPQARALIPMEPTHPCYPPALYCRSFGHKFGEVRTWCRYCHKFDAVGPTSPVSSVVRRRGDFSREQRMVAAGRVRTN